MDLKSIFDNAPREYAIYPIIHDKMNSYQAEINSYHEKGFAGVVSNIKYDRNYPENRELWDNFARGCRTYIAKGMKLWIYDEHGYPSGTAGGVVLDRHPEYECKEIVYYSYWKTLIGEDEYRADIPSGKLYKAYLIKLGSNGEYADISDGLDERGTLRFTIPQGAWRLVVFITRRLFDATHSAHSYSEPRRYIDLFNPKATEAFLDVTHEKYKAVLGDEFGKGVRAFFTDEPSLQGWSMIPIAYPRLSWSDEFPNIFKKRFGYDAGESLMALFLNFGKNNVKACCDFWELQADLTADSFFGVIQSWCRKNNVASSGHLILEEGLVYHTLCYGSYYRCMKKMCFPGIDQLETEPDKLMGTSAIPVARLAASFADLYDLGETFTEASDHTSRNVNRQISLDWIRASVNWHQAMGINNITSYYNFGHFSDEELRQLNNYVSRIGAVLRQGKRYSRAAVLYPECTMWASVKPSTKAYHEISEEEPEELQKIFAGTSWELLHRQIDFDYIDEQELCASPIEGGIIKAQKRNYECIILPHCWVMTKTGFSRICEFLDQGGKVIVVGRPPSIERDTGIPGIFAEKINSYRHNINYISVTLAGFGGAAGLLPTTISLRPAIASVLSGYAGDLKGSELISENILSHIRKITTQDGREELLIFLCNMGSTVYHASLETEGDWNVEKGDPQTGAVFLVKTGRTNGMTCFDITLKAYESMVLYLS
ncbi:MAG: hypothetical protein LBS48_06165 [Treponema sp.]|jgi:hypothetical protein|nr:hypothetical protein [Treponema sp.]